MKRLLLLMAAVYTISAYCIPAEFIKTSGSIKVNGTSSLHEWEMNLENFNVEAGIVLEGSDLKSFDRVVFSCNATDLKSESSLMDKKAWEALKAVSFPKIEFVSTSVSDVVVTGDSFIGNLKGILSIAGVKKSITVPFKGKIITVNAKNRIEVESLIKLQMTDFQISPPTAMLGTLKTGDKISISLLFQLTTK
jgi:polyisoprenoid-binding protein YceI